MVESSMAIRDAVGWISSHPKASGFVVRCPEAVAIALEHLHGLAVGENGGNSLHGRIHRAPEILIPLRRREHDRCATNSVLVGSQAQIDAAWVSRKIGRIGGLHLPKPPYCDRDMCIGRGAKLIVKVK